MYFHFKPINITECKLCKRIHTSNGYLVRKIIEDVFYIKNYSSYCKASTFNWDSNNLIQEILSNPGSDQPYAILVNAIFNSYGHSIVCSGNDIFMFNSIIWKEISKLKMQSHIIHTTESILLLLIKYISDVEVRKTLKKAYHYISKIVYIKIIVSYYKALYNDDEIKAKMNINSDILPVKNGVIDLRTGVLNIENPDGYMSIQLKVNYKELDYPTSTIDKFIADLFNDNKELFTFVQKLLGYGITGHTNMQVWVMFTGDESNGKSLLVSLIEDLLQGWFTVAPYEIFFNSNKKASEGAHLTHLVAIKDKKVCIRSEFNPENKLNTEILKIIIGGDSITARRAYESSYETFIPIALPILMCNYKLEIDTEDPAMLRRIIVIPFNNIYTTSDDPTRPYNLNNPRHKLRNSNLKAKLKATHVKKKLLIWLVKEAMLWYSDKNFEQPLSIINARESYLAENDKVQQYIDENCYVNFSDKNCYILAADFRKQLNSDMFTNFIQIKLAEIMKSKEFSYKVIKENGISKRVYVGLKFSSNYYTF